MEKQAMATLQAGACGPTHHTSRHPNGTLVPLMKEVETVNVAATRQRVPRAVQAWLGGTARQLCWGSWGNIWSGTKCHVDVVDELCRKPH